MDIPLVPIWLLGHGQYLCTKRYEHREAQLIPETLHVGSGYLFEFEEHIPLETTRILFLREGPILRKMGLAALTIETAGDSQQGMPDASLTGLVNAVAFRDAVLDQRARYDLPPQHGHPRDGGDSTVSGRLPTPTKTKKGQGRSPSSGGP